MIKRKECEAKSEKEQSKKAKREKEEKELEEQKEKVTKGERQCDCCWEHDEGRVAVILQRDFFTHELTALCLKCRISMKCDSCKQSYCIDEEGNNIHRCLCTGYHCKRCGHDDRDHGIVDGSCSDPEYSCDDIEEKHFVGYLEEEVKENILNNNTFTNTLFVFKQ